MGPMTLDEAKETIEHFHRHDAGRRNRAALMLLDALRAAEARAEAAEKRAANARREAFEEARERAAKVADDDATAAESTCASFATGTIGALRHGQRASESRRLARDIRALAPAPEAKAEATPATVVVHRCNTDNGREVCTFEADHGGAHSWTPAFDARKFAEALVEGLSPPRGVAFHPEDPAVYHVRQAVMRAVAIAAGSEP